MPAPPAARIAQLRATLARHDELYYKKTAPEISDPEYDRLKKALEALEQAHPELAGPSPTQTVGDDRTEGFATARHRAPMLSLDNTYNQDELRDFDTRLRRVLAEKGFAAPARDLAYVVEPKVDGLAVCLTYEKGKFTRAVTRGNGVEGDDISANVRTVRGLPLELRGRGHPAVLELRGEIFLATAEFRRINAEREEAGLPLYANPRNLAAGTAKLLDPREAARRHLCLVLYGLGFCEPLPCAMQFELHQLLRDWGLPAHPKDNVWRAHGADEIWARIQQLDSLRGDFAYATDGAVVKLDDFAGQRLAEATAKAPRWAMAYKFAPEQAETTLRGIIIQVGRTGILAPVADLEPVFLAGSTISRATLHNADEIARKDIRVGDTVVIEKAGEVIPAVVRVVMEKRPTKSSAYHFVEYCPACGTKAVRPAGEVAWRCPNPACPPQVARRLQFFCTRKALDIEDVGEIVADSLTKTGRIKDPLDLFTLTIPELGRLNLGDEESPRVFGEKNATRVIEALQRAKELPLSRWLYALGIANVGDVTAKELTYNHKDFFDLSKSKLLPKIVEKAKLDAQKKKLHGVKEGLEALDKFLFPFRIQQTLDPDMAEIVRKNYRQLRQYEKKRTQLNNNLKNVRKTEVGETPKDEEFYKAEELKLKQKIEKLKTPIDDLNEWLRPYPILDEIGSEVAKSISTFFASKDGFLFLNRLYELGLNPRSDNLRTATELGALAGKTLVLTGTLPNLKRQEAAKLIEEAGGHVSSSVSKETDYLVAGEEAGSKLDKARELGVKILDETGLRLLVEHGTKKSSKTPPKDNSQGLLL
jgi:DNA ligase (NAD+)